MRKHIYADESGNFDFSASSSASKYFILTTVSIPDHQISADLLELRRDIAWEGIDIRNGFHATEDKQRVRDRVFGILAQHEFRVDATIIEKRKTQPHWRRTDSRFYQHVWYYHMKFIAPQILFNGEEMLVIAASIGTKKRRRAFRLLSTK